MHDGSIRINTKIDNSGAEKGLSSLTGSLKKFAGIVGIAFGIGAIINFSKTAVNEASKMQSAFIGLQSILEGQGRSFNKAQAFINDYISDGLIPLNNAVTAYKNLALRGYDDGQIKQTMIALKDASSFARQSNLSMGEAIQSASEGLKNENSILVDNAGVTKNVAKMWDEYAKSIGTTANNLTQQQKIQAEVNGILEETKFQTGDAAKYADSYAGTVSKFNSTLTTFKQNLGSLLQGLFAGIVKGATTVIGWLDKLVLFIGAIFKSFTGKDLFKASASSSGKIADDFGGVASSLDKAYKKAKKIKKTITEFDEMAILNDNSSSYSGSSGGGGASTSMPDFSSLGDISIPDNISPRIQKIADKIKTIFKDVMSWIKDNKDWLKFTVTFIGFGLIGLLIKEFIDLYNSSEEFRQSIVELGNTWANALYPIVEFITTVFNDAWNTIFVPAFEYATQTLIPQIQEVLQELWKKVLVPIANFVGVVLTPVFRILFDVLTMIWQNAILPLANAVGELFAKSWDSIYNILTKTVLPILNVVIDVLTWLWKNVINPIVEVLWNLLKPAFEGVFKHIKIIIDGAKEFFKGLLDFITGIFTLDFKKAFEGIKNMLKSIWDSIVNIIKNAWSTILGLFSQGGKIFMGVVDGIGNIFKTIINALISGINKVIALPFDTVNGLLNTIRNIGFLGIEPFKGLWKNNPLPVPQIPRLAKGGIVMQPTQAIIGEAGKEAVLPLENNTEWMDKLASKIGRLNGSSQSINIYLPNGKLLAQYVIDTMNKQDFVTNGGVL